MPVAAAHARARGRTPPTGTRPSRTSMPCVLGRGLGQARSRRPRGRCRRPTGSRARRSATFSPAITSAATLRLVRRLVGEHRLADDVADRVDVRHVRAHLRVDADEAALVDVHARRLGADASRRSARRPTATRMRSNVCVVVAELDAPGRRRAASTDSTRSAGGSPRSAPSMRLCSGVTRSLSAPGMSWSSSSTTVTLRAERVVDRRHLQADDPAADDQQPLGDLARSSSAPVESMTRGSSGRPGSVAGCEPAAMMQCSNAIGRASSTSSVCRAR